MEPFPRIVDESLKSLARSLKQIARLRDNDILDRNSFDSMFFRGRKVSKIPTSSIDVVETDRIGDINYDTSYLYVLVNNSGTPEWRRASLGSW